MKYPSIRFALIVGIWSLMLLLASILFLSRQPVETIKSFLLNGSSIMARIRVLFSFSDDWNIIGLIFILTISIIVFSANDIFLKRLFIGISGASEWRMGMVWIAKTLLNGLCFFVEFIIICYIINASTSSPDIVDSNEIQKGKHTVLLLGTSKFLRGTNTYNIYYQERIGTCVRLFRAGKIKEIVISGDRESVEYDEPRDMKKDLVAQGVPDHLIKLDPFGYRTFDSIKRLKKMIGSRNSNQEPVIIISQYFHLERALYLAKSEKVNAVGVPAEGNLTLKMMERELFAKAKVLLDIYIFNTQTNGVESVSRRHINFNRVEDNLILLFVLASAALAGRMTRPLLQY